MNALQTLDAGEVFVAASGILAAFALIATIGATLRGNLRRVASAAVVCMLCVLAAAIGAVCIAVNPTNPLTG